MSILNPQTGLYEYPPKDGDLVEMRDRMKAQAEEQDEIKN